MKAFEIAVKQPKKVLRYIADENGTIKTKTMRGISGIMGAATHIGTDWQAASYELITCLTRGEWGFQGVFSTDMGLEAMPGNLDKLLRAGCDVRMHFMPLETAMDFSTPTLLDKTTATYKQAVRHSMHDLCYAYANSNLMQNMAPGSTTYYKTSPWKIGLTIGTCVVSAAIAGLAVWTVLRCVRYNKKKEK